MSAIISPKGLFCYQVLPFGLKGFGATYQWAMMVILKEMLRDVIDRFVDD